MTKLTTVMASATFARMNSALVFASIHLSRWQYTSGTRMILQQQLIRCSFLSTCVGLDQHCFNNTHIISRMMQCRATTTDSSNESSYNNELVIAILGPPNAGKSTLYNRLLDKAANRSYKLASEKRRRKKYSGGRLGSKASLTQRGGAIVSNVPGTTRDRRECWGRIGEITFRLIDTAGIDGQRIMDSKSKKKQNNNHQHQHEHHHLDYDDHNVTSQMMNQTWQAAQTADLIFLVMDARVGITTDWMETARWLRKASAAEKVVILANKLEGDAWDFDGSPILDNLEQVSRVGFGPAIAISALHGEGLAQLAVTIGEFQTKKHQQIESQDTDMMDQNVDDDEKDENDDDDGHEDVEDRAKGEKPLQVAILGRQNVGKSTLVNALLHRDRVICGPMPGLTRDAIAVEWTYRGRPVQLVDTAGIRRIARRSDDIEDLAVQDAMRAMKVADVAVLVLDAQATKLERQELAIADAVVKEGRALVVVANKQDLVVDAEYSAPEFAKAVKEHLETRLPMLRKTPVVAMSSLHGTNVQALMPVVFRARDRWARVVSTGILNRWLKEVLYAHPPPMQCGRPTKIKYIVQTKGRPPTFLLFCNHTELPVSYIRYLIRNFQDTFEYFGMEVRMSIKKSASENPYEGKRKRSGSGVGGRQARTKRNIAQLMATGSIQGRRRWRRRRR